MFPVVLAYVEKKTTYDGGDQRYAFCRCYVGFIGHIYDHSSPDAAWFGSTTSARVHQANSS